SGVEDPLRLGPPGWKLDQQFDLGYHLRRMRVPDGGSIADVLAAAQVLAMAPFDRARPLWEAVLVEGLPGDQAAYVLKLHHSLLDGQAGIQLFDILHSARAEATPDKPTTQREPEPLPSAAGRLARQLAGSLGGLRRRAGGAIELAGDLLLRPEPTV